MRTIGLSISTLGRPTLIDTLSSVYEQGLIDGDRVIVSFDGPPRFDISIDQYKKLFPWAEFMERTHESGAWGHGQTNKNFEKLHNTVDVITAQDDDDIFAPRSFDVMREHANKFPGYLLMSRAYNHAWGLLWRSQNWDEELVEGDERFVGNMAHDGHSVWFPGNAPIFPKLGLPYNGDQEYIQAARLLFWDRTHWCPEVTSITRPVLTFGWKLNYVLVRTSAQVEMLRVLRNECREGMTGFTGVVDKGMQKRWWDGNKHAMRAFLMMDGPSAVGFVVLRPFDEGGLFGHDRMTATIGVGQRYRRKGYGREIAQFAVLAAQGPLVGTAYSNNPVLPLDYEAGWEKTGEHDGLTELEMKWPPKFLTAKR